MDQTSPCILWNDDCTAVPMCGYRGCRIFDSHEPRPTILIEKDFDNHRRNIGDGIGEIEAIVMQLALEQSDALRNWRRHFHAHPELTGTEYATTAAIERSMHKLGLETHLAGDRRGVWCDLGSGDRRVIIRGDMDALPIQTELTAKYRSTVDGVMHACGHDVHTTCVMGAASVAVELVRRSRLDPASFALRFCFQPAEENSTGGPHMIQAGVTGTADAAIALHVDPGRPVGTIGIRRGAFTAGCDLFRIVMRGRGGHSARPHLTDDVLVAMTTWINECHTRIPRVCDALSPVVFNIGMLNAGVAPNVVPAEATARGTLRCGDPEGRRTGLETMRRIADSISHRFGIEVELKIESGTPPLINNNMVTAAIETSAIELLGHENVASISRPSMGAEDFAFLAAEVPASMFRLGIAETPQINDAGRSPGDRELVGHRPLHTPNFDVDERCLAVGAAVLVSSAIRFSRHGIV